MHTGRLQRGFVWAVRSSARRCWSPLYTSTSPSTGPCQTSIFREIGSTPPAGACLPTSGSGSPGRRRGLPSRPMRPGRPYAGAQAVPRCIDVEGGPNPPAMAWSVCTSPRAGCRVSGHDLTPVPSGVRSNGSRKNYGFITFKSEDALGKAVRGLPDPGPVWCQVLLAGAAGLRGRGAGQHAPECAVGCLRQARGRQCAAK